MCVCVCAINRALLDMSSVGLSKLAWFRLNTQHVEIRLPRQQGQSTSMTSRTGCFFNWISGMIWIYLDIAWCSNQCKSEELEQCKLIYIYIFHDLGQWSFWAPCCYFPTWLCSIISLAQLQNCLSGFPDSPETLGARNVPVPHNYKNVHCTFLKRKA